MNSHFLTLSDAHNKLNKIFELEKEIILKDAKIAALEFEVALQKQLQKNLKETALHFFHL